MPPARNDGTLRDEQFLLRVLRPEWVKLEGNRERPTSDCFTDSNQENSCFIEDEITVGEIGHLFPGRKLARIPVAAVRAEGYFIERRPGPEDVPPGCTNPQAHVIAGPPEMLPRKEYQRRSRRIVTHHNVTVLSPPIRPVF